MTSSPTPQETELDTIYAYFNPDCDGNGFVVGDEGVLYTCGYCGCQLKLDERAEELKKYL